MKLVLKFILLQALLCWAASASAQLVYWSGLRSAVQRNLVISKALREDCNWNYAIVRLQTDKSNRVTLVRVLNTTSEAAHLDFSFLKGFQFPRKLKLNGRPLVFAASIDNSDVPCNTTRYRNYSYTEAVGIIGAQFDAQERKEPNTLFMHEHIAIKLFATVH